MSSPAEEAAAAPRVAARHQQIAARQEADRIAQRDAVLSAIMDSTANVSKALTRAWESGWKMAGGGVTRCDFDCSYCAEDTEELGDEHKQAAAVLISEAARRALGGGEHHGTSAAA